jgi:hypothetical protein
LFSDEPNCLTEEDLKQIKHDLQITFPPSLKRRLKSRKSTDENGNHSNWSRETLSATINEHWIIQDHSIGKIQTPPKRLSSKRGSKSKMEDLEKESLKMSIFKSLPDDVEKLKKIRDLLSRSEISNFN